MATLEKIEKDIIRTKAKISEYQQKLRNLEAQKVEAENLQIVNLVKAVKLSTPQLTVLLSAYAKGDVLLPDEYEEGIKRLLRKTSSRRTARMKNKIIAILSAALYALAECAE